jgi:hypothetical protein
MGASTNVISNDVARGSNLFYSRLIAPGEIDCRECAISQQKAMQESMNVS